MLCEEVGPQTLIKDKAKGGSFHHPGGQYSEEKSLGACLFLSLGMVGRIEWCL